MFLWEHQGVFFGYVSEGTELKDRQIALRRARNCLYWPEQVKGFIGLAVTGPLSGSRVGPAAGVLLLTGVTSIAWASSAAVAAWEGGKWD